MLAYIDESGSLHPNAPESITTLAAVCVPKSQVRSVIAKMFNIKNELFPENYLKELKAAKSLRPRTLNKDYKSKFFVDRVVHEILCSIPDIQLADLCAGIIRKYYELCYEKQLSDSFSLWIKELYEQIFTKTEKVYSPHNELLYGIFKMPDKYLLNR